jgi:uncharacterized membrane protein YdjX (TVP38/TMEM64 family)
MELDLEKLTKETEASLTRSKIALSIIFSLAFAVLILLILSAPDIAASDKDTFLTFPRTIDQIRALHSSIQNYTTTSYNYVLCLFCFLYLLLQSFAIPGPIILSILAGALFGRLRGLIIVSCCATCGACLCYTLSNFFGKGIIIRKYPSRVVDANKKIQEHKDNLLFYLLFLRLTPIVPNWLINLASPIIGVPFGMFVLATLLGLMPANWIHINAGMTLATIDQVGLTMDSVLLLLGLAFVALIPTIFINRNKSKNS